MIIVTGAAGFIGSGIIAGLNKQGRTDILAVDKLDTDTRWKNLRGLQFADYLEKDDFLKMVQDNEIIPPIEAVIHMGACSSTTQTDCSFLVKNNYEYSKILAQWAANSDIRFIYASSAATYGDGSQGFDDDEKNIEKFRPLNMYGYSKQMFDMWVRQAGLFNKFVGLKYFNVFGPNEYHKGPMRSFVLKAFEQIREKNQVGLFKSYRPEYQHGQQVRDFVYVKDAIAMTLFFLNNPDISGLYNIGTGKPRTWNDLVKATFNALNKEPNIKYIDMPDSIKGQYQYYTSAKMDKIKSAGYDKPVMNLENAITDYVQNYLQTDDYLEGV